METRPLGVPRPLSVQSISVTYIRDTPMTQLMVLMALLQGSKSIWTLAGLCNCSDTTIKRHVTALRKEGFNIQFAKATESFILEEVA